jgi:hypothetical protein
VTATFVFGQDIDLAVKWVCGLMEWFAQHLAALDVFALGAAQQDADVVACLTLVEQFAGNAGADGLLRVSNTDLDFFADFDNTALDTDRSHVPRPEWRTRLPRASGRHRPRRALAWDVGVQGVSQLHDGFFAQRALSPSMASLAAVDDGVSSPGNRASSSSRFHL